MEFVVTKLNYTAYELDRLYNINSGGCCYLAYKIAYWLEKYGIEYYFVIQNDNPIINDIGKHYCLQVLPSKLYLNKSPLYTHIKSIKRTSSQILDYYKKSSWSEKYDALNNVFVDNLIDNIFEFKINTWREDKFERSVANGTETVFVTLRFCVVRKQLKATLKPNAAGVQLPPHYYRNG